MDYTTKADIQKKDIVRRFAREYGLPESTIERAQQNAEKMGETLPGILADQQKKPEQKRLDAELTQAKERTDKIIEKVNESWKAIATDREEREVEWLKRQAERKKRFEEWETAQELKKKRRQEEDEEFEAKQREHRRAIEKLSDEWEQKLEETKKKLEAMRNTDFE